MLGAGVAIPQLRRGGGSGGAPSWVFSGAALDYDYANDRYYAGGALLASRAAAHTFNNDFASRSSVPSGGGLQADAADILRLDNLYSPQAALVEQLTQANNVRIRTVGSLAVTGITYNATGTISDPLGGTVASRMAMTTGAGQKRMDEASISLAPSGGNSHTTGNSFVISMCFKFNTGVPWVALDLRESASHVGRVWFNIETGQIGSTELVGSGLVNASGILDLGNGWYRCWANITPRSGGVATTLLARIWFGNADLAVSWNPSGSERIDIFGWQIEPVVDRPSSIILSSGATFSASNNIRNSDEVSVAINTFLTGSAGTLIWSGRVMGRSMNTSGGAIFSTGYPIQIDDGSNSNVVRWEYDGTNVVAKVRAGGSEVASLASTAYTLGDRITCGLAWSANDFAAQVDEGTVGTDGTGSAPSGLTTLRLGRDHAGANGCNVRIDRIILVNSRLPNGSF